jgi:hypothetical protein
VVDVDAPPEYLQITPQPEPSRATRRTRARPSRSVPNSRTGRAGSDAPRMELPTSAASPARLEASRRWSGSATATQPVRRNAPEGIGGESLDRWGHGREVGQVLGSLLTDPTWVRPEPPLGLQPASGGDVSPRRRSSTPTRS